MGPDTAGRPRRWGGEGRGRLCGVSPREARSQHLTQASLS